MSTRGIHSCMEQAGAPAHDGDFAEGTRWVCACGSNYVYREGFTREGHLGMDWWGAPPVVVPGPRHRRPSGLTRLIRPRQG